MISDADQALYARQILLPELGLAGQARLAATEVSFAQTAEPRARAVAHDYLSRAGLASVDSSPGAAASSGRTRRQVELPSCHQLQVLAGEPALEECAAWLAGALAAVELIKASCGAGEPVSLAADFVLATEVR